MKSVLKRAFTVDRDGRVLASDGERLLDSGDGRLSVTTHRTTLSCPGCTRPIADIAELRGRCDYCQRTALCEACATTCQSCSRRLGPCCRRGVPGQSPSALCPNCWHYFLHRQAYQDQLLRKHAAFQRRILLQREWYRLQALRLNAARTRAALRMAAIRERNRFAQSMMQAKGHGRFSLW
jgi:hypothetical protein